MELKTAISSFHLNQQLFQDICSVLEDERIQMIHNEIQNVLDPDVSSQNTPIAQRQQRCFAVKNGLNGLLDVARQSYRETTTDIHNLTQQYREEYNIQFKMVYNPMGFYLETKRGVIQKQNLPALFLNVLEKKHVIQCSTLELLKLNDRIKESMDEIYLLSNKIIEELLTSLRSQISVLYAVTEAISIFDVLLSLSQCAHINGYGTKNLIS